MFKEIITMKRYTFENGFSTWEDAVCASCKVLINQNIITEKYTESIIQCIKKYGPYIIIGPNIAMPHSTENGEGVNGTAISFMKTVEPVHFEPGNPEKDAYLFFTLAANNPEKHLKNIQLIATELSDEDVVNKLMKSNSVEDLKEVQQIIEEKKLNQIYL